jgi:hypothetical protein
MQLTNAQLLLLKAAILAETDSAIVMARTQNDTGTLSTLYNADSTNIVWRNATRCADILAAITWASYTPADAPDTTQIYMNRAMLCQLKRDNLWCMLARDTLVTSTAVTRTNLSDALQNVPAGVAGANLDAGWLGAGKVKTTISRPATKGEAVFISGSGTSGTPVALVLEGQITNDNIVAALAAQ